MRIRRSEWPVLIVNLAYVAVFGALSVARLNYEFVIYCGVIIVVLGAVIWCQERVRFPAGVLWGLTLWGFLHMAGGHVPVGDGRLYDVILVPILQRGDLAVLRYDQVVHAIGFGVAAYVCFHLLRPSLDPARVRRPVIAALVLLMGMGLGALNEVLEFIVVLVAPQSGVGGYYNTALDLLSNTVGAGVAAGIAAARLGPRPKPMADSESQEQLPRRA
jgi:uncharacterized membrane protein YjdF